MRLPEHHAAWLSAHPERTADWLRDQIADGFDVHHLDGDPRNNAPSNLVLIEHVDHMRLHFGAQADLFNRLREIPAGQCRGRRRETRKQAARRELGSEKEIRRRARAEKRELVRAGLL